MSLIFDAILGLTSNEASSDKSSMVRTFANELGWTPSYDLFPSHLEAYANIHLVVEHGLENSAVLTFLKKPFNTLEEKERRALLNISYNNLVDWHIHIDREKATFTHNRSSQLNSVIQESPFRRDYYDSLRSEAFEKLIGKKLSLNIPTLDDALINTISLWKRNISAELNNEISNESLSSLFNAIIFLRALEDNINRYAIGNKNEKVLIQALRVNDSSLSFTFSGIISKAQEILGKGNIPKYLINKNSLKPFDRLDRQTILLLFTDFYQNRVAGFYNYDFSIMSKHALSRVYEKYSVLLKVEETSQLAMFAKVPYEESNKAMGAIYTPEYVARFFSRYLQHNLTPRDFVNLRVAEPAIGSGIFLRTLLELKCEILRSSQSLDQIKSTFKGILGIDVDGNACQAARLSLALLQLVLTDEFPDSLNIFQFETIEYVNNHPEIVGTFDAVLSNPPFIATEMLSKELKDRIVAYLGDDSSGRPDSYLAFLKAGIELLKPGGFGLYVLPHSFLISKNGSQLRKLIHQESWIRCLADLSAIPVFGNTGIYVVLLIFQKKSQINVLSPKSTIIKCRELVGKALQDGINGKFSDNNFYSVFEVDQSFFKDEQWNILPFKETVLKERLAEFPKLSEFLEVRQGFVTGADDVFIVEKEKRPPGEEGIYIPYLPDRKIDRYATFRGAVEYVIYPFEKGTRIDEEELKRNYPITWKYLKSNEDHLKSKKSFTKTKEWWRPLRTRQPEHLLIPKIVTPHLTITPKFSLDAAGKYGISRSPFLISKLSASVSMSVEKEMLLYFLAVLNSTPCFWFVSNHSHKYSKGYTMLEVKTLENTPVPDPSKVPVGLFKKIVNLVTKRLNSNPIDGEVFEIELDSIICDLYNMSTEEKRVIGLGNEFET